MASSEWDTGRCAETHRSTRPVESLEGDRNPPPCRLPSSLRAHFWRLNPWREREGANREDEIEGEEGREREGERGRGVKKRRGERERSE